MFNFCDSTYTTIIHNYQIITSEIFDGISPTVQIPYQKMSPHYRTKTNIWNSKRMIAEIFYTPKLNAQVSKLVWIPTHYYPRQLLEPRKKPIHNQPVTILIKGSANSIASFFLFPMKCLRDVIIAPNNRADALPVAFRGLWLLPVMRSLEVIKFMAYYKVLATEL